MPLVAVVRQRRCRGSRRLSAAQQGRALSRHPPTIEQIIAVMRSPVTAFTGAGCAA
jgi:hypothetical protein